MKNLARDVESIALALSEEGGYEYYHIDDELKGLAKDVSDMQAENSKLRKYVAWLEKWALDHASFGLSAEVQFELDMARRELGVEVDT